MPRDTSRKQNAGGNLVHANVHRNSAGTVQMTAVTTNTGNTVTGTTTTTPLSTTLENPNLVAFTSATISGSGGGAGNTATINLIRNGSTILDTSGTGAISTSVTGTNQTHTDPLQNPVYSVQVIANGGTATWSFSLSREQQWV